MDSTYITVFLLTFIMQLVWGDKGPDCLSLDRMYSFPTTFDGRSESGDSLVSNNSTEVESVTSTTESLADAIRKQEIVEAAESTNFNSLLRRRRYLIFPEGSSLQLVFCLTYGMYVGIADIFYMGATASLAWELPQDPYSPFEHHAEALHRIDKGKIVYKDVKGSQKLNGWNTNRILVNKITGEPIQPFAKDYYNKNNNAKRKNSAKWSEKPHKRKLIVNPVFAKRSADSSVKKPKRVKKKSASRTFVDREAMHEERNDRKHLNSEYMNPHTAEFHRISRRGLYGKIEKLIVGMGYHGRECVLKSLCEMGQDRLGRQGTFLEEIMRVIFTLPKGKPFEESNHQNYDDAHSTKKNCIEMYPECTISIKSLK